MRIKEFCLGGYIIVDISLWIMCKISIQPTDDLCYSPLPARAVLSLWASAVIKTGVSMCRMATQIAIPSSHFSCNSGPHYMFMLFRLTAHVHNIHVWANISCWGYWGFAVCLSKLVTLLVCSYHMSLHVYETGREHTYLISMLSLTIPTLTYFHWLESKISILQPLILVNKVLKENYFFRLADN